MTSLVAFATGAATNHRLNASLMVMINRFPSSLIENGTQTSMGILENISLPPLFLAVSAFHCTRTVSVTGTPTLERRIVVLSPGSSSRFPSELLDISLFGTYRSPVGWFLIALEEWWSAAALSSSFSDLLHMGEHFELVFSYRSDGSLDRNMTASGIQVVIP